MSWAIGPWIGKRDAVIARVQAAHDYDADQTQINSAKSLMTAELSRYNDSDECYAQGEGQQGFGRYMMFAVNRNIQAIEVPHLA